MIEGNVTALDAKLDLILDRFKSTHVKEVENEDVVEEWTRDIEEAWNELKPRGRPAHKPTKPFHPPRLSQLPREKKVTQSTMNAKGLPQKIISLKGHLK